MPGGGEVLCASAVRPGGVVGSGCHPRCKDTAGSSAGRTCYRPPCSPEVLHCRSCTLYSVAVVQFRNCTVYQLYNVAVVQCSSYTV